MPRLTLSALVSQVLVAITIEFDNEFEQRMPHRTTDYGGTPGAPWLVSLAMWFNCMQFVGPDGVRVGELENLARTKTNLPGMERWGYVVVAPHPAEKILDPPRSEWLIRPTKAGSQAQQFWRSLFPLMEQRWQERFGEDAMQQLHERLRTVLERVKTDTLADCLPIVGYGLWSNVSRRKPLGPMPRNQDDSLPALLSRLVLAFALEFEADAPCSMAIASNVLRVLNEDGVLFKDLSLLTGLAPNAIPIASGFLQRSHLAKVVSYPSGDKVAFLTPRGREVQLACMKRRRAVDDRWKDRCGEDNIRKLRDSVEALVSKGILTAQPHPGCWRSLVPPAKTLPHFPLVTHRGGFPDGS